MKHSIHLFVNLTKHFCEVDNPLADKLGDCSHTTAAILTLEILYTDNVRPDIKEQPRKESIQSVNE